MSAAREQDELARRGVVDLSSRVVLVLTGADRVRYLNGQVTANVAALRPGRAQPACVTTAKGRLCAEIMVTARADALYVDADAALAEVLLPRLERYIIADDVAVSSPGAGTRLLHFLEESPPADVRERPEFEVVQARRFGGDGWDLWGADEAVEAVWGGIVRHRSLLEEAQIERLRIERGVPRWGRELDEQTLPPEAGLELTHVDYHKGCYVGQEVISRLKSVGHVNRKLTGFAASGSAPLSVGAEVLAGNSLEVRVGTLTSTTWSFALDKAIALGYLKRSSPAEGLFIRGPGGEPQPITVHALPFTL